MTLSNIMSNVNVFQIMMFYYAYTEVVKSKEEKMIMNITTIHKLKQHLIMNELYFIKDKIGHLLIGNHHT